MAVGLGVLNILVIDDNEQIRSVIGTLLKSVGVGNVHFATDGARGLEVLFSQPIDIVYVDQEMPEVKGLAFIREVRALTNGKQFTPIIMMTAHSDRARLEAALSAGVTEFLAKPLTTKAVMARLNAVIMNPRPFVRGGPYFGPDRRRRAAPDYSGPKRRIADRTDALEI